MGTNTMLQADCEFGTGQVVSQHSSLGEWGLPTVSLNGTLTLLLNLYPVSATFSGKKLP